MVGMPGMRSAVLPVASFLDLSMLRTLLNFRRRPAFLRSVAVFSGEGGYLSPVDRLGA